MVKLNQIVKFLNEYLKINDIQDDSWNGLQLEGKSEVNKIMFAVDTGIDTFKKAVEEKADMLIVHHGFFWKPGNPSLVGYNKKRMEILGKNNISLYASHLPLDRHKEVGNNAQLLKLLGAKIKKEFGMHHRQNVGWIGELRKSVNIKQIAQKLATELNAKCKVISFGKQDIKTIAVCSGGGGYPCFFEAINSDVDLYITGDTIDAYTTIKDAKFNVIFAGHHASEIVGVKALSKVLARKFRLKTKFVDLPTGL